MVFDGNEKSCVRSVCHLLSGKFGRTYGYSDSYFLQRQGRSKHDRHFVDFVDVIMIN